MVLGDTYMIQDITDQNFETEVLQNKLPVLVDFWADWCQPCLNLAKTLKPMSDENTDKIFFAKMNVDTNTEIPIAYGVRSIPYILLFKDGEVIDSLIGNQTKEKIENFLQSVY